MRYVLYNLELFKTFNDIKYCLKISFVNSWIFGSYKKKSILIVYVNLNDENKCFVFFL